MNEAELKRITPPNAADKVIRRLILQGKQKYMPRYPQHFYRGSMVKAGSAEEFLPRPFWNRYP